jgi:argininosuccinate lyase
VRLLPQDDNEEETTMTNNTMWGGRFKSTSDPRFRALNDSFAFDRELLQEDVTGSIAWAQALEGAGVLTAAECQTIVKALESIRSPNASDESFEDVHSYVETKLREQVGELAGKLHTGRSRNDQVATDLKLWMKSALQEARAVTIELAEALAKKASAEAGTAMPGYTHLKQAEPVTFGHWCLAYFEMLLRDIDRFDTALQRNDSCPLGSGALAGSPVNVDREKLAAALGFARTTRNSLDGVSDRDILSDYLYATSLMLVHLSRMAEDLILFSSDEFGFVELPDALASGSSRMPQKKNPDLLELTRGHAARSIGEVTAILSLLKGLPLAYNKDLQLDKEPAFRTRALLANLLPALAALIEQLSVSRDVMREAASSELLLATQVADAIAARGVPFRVAHEYVGKRVGTGIALAAIEPDSEVTREDLQALNVDLALEKKNVVGGTAPSRVAAAAAEALSIIGSLK